MPRPSSGSGDGKLTVHDKMQGAAEQPGLCRRASSACRRTRSAWSRPSSAARFGSGLRPQYQLFLAVMAALELEALGAGGADPRPDVHLRLPARRRSRRSRSAPKPDGTLQSIMHDAVAGDLDVRGLPGERRQLVGLLYHCDNVKLTYKLAKLDTYTPGDMRAPGRRHGRLRARDRDGRAGLRDRHRSRSSCGCGTTPRRTRTRTSRFTSKELRACYRQGAERFGWSQAQSRAALHARGPRAVGWGMATGVWEAHDGKDQPPAPS